jgi:hypothetical protein
VKLPFVSLLKAARPPHAFALTRDRLVYVRRAPKKKGTLGIPEIETFARPLPAGAFTETADGTPLAGPLLARALGAILEEAGKRPSVASLAVPDDYVHVLAVDVEDPDQSPKETDEILSWKLAKTFGEPAPPLRVAWQSAGPGATGTRVLAVAAPEEAAASWEAPFASLGIRIGAVETASLAIAALGKKAVSGSGFLVWADGDAATTIFLKDGSVRFIRTKKTSDPDEALQEIRLAASFVASDLARTGGEPPALDIDGACAAGPPGSPVVERLRAFRAESGGRDPSPLSRAALVSEPGSAGARTPIEDPSVLVALGAMAGE